MSVKIFLPKDLFHFKENCELYGEVQINENNSVSYFVTSFKNESVNMCDYKMERHRYLGNIQHLNCKHDQDVALTFAYDKQTPNIYLVKLGIKPANANEANIFLYDVEKMLQLHYAHPIQCSGNSKSVYSKDDYQWNDVEMLYAFLHQYDQSSNSHRKNTLLTPIVLLYACLNYLLELISQIFGVILQFKFIKVLIEHTMLYEHFKMWQRYRATNKRNLNIKLDRIFGLILTLALLSIVPHPGDYLIQVSHGVIKHLRILLRALQGSPIGLKLNVHLNNFFLDCFNYHIDLWATFINFIEPLVKFLFVPIAILGTMGATFQLALLADLITIISLHTHCFYIYAAVLYKVEIKGLQVLWKVVLGKRYNFLKMRVESYNYTNSQLYLATIFFTCLLFLFPTILVYYIVFTTLRLCIYTVQFVLQLQRHRMLEFPLQLLLKWLVGKFYEKDSLQLQHEQHMPSPLLQSETMQMRMSVFNLNVQASPLSRMFSCENVGILLQEEKSNQGEGNTKSIFKRILEGTF